MDKPACEVEASAPTSGLPRRALALIAGVITAFQLSPYWVERYSPGLDESYQLQAGTRLARGKGLTTQWSFDADNLADIAEPKYERMTYWAPPYAWFFAGLLRGGLDPEAAAIVLRLLQAIAAFVGSYGWLRLADRFLEPAWFAVFALGLAGLLFGNTLLGNSAFVGPSHLFFWAIIPYFLSNLIAALATGSLLRFAAVGALAALATGVRYNAVYLAPAAGLAALLWTSAPMRRRWAASAIASAPAALLLLTFLILNKLAGTDASGVHDLAKGFHPGNLLNRFLITVFFVFGFGLEETVFRLRPSWREGASFLWFVPWYALLALAAKLGLNRACERWTPDHRRLAGVTLLMGLFLVLMLAAVAVRIPPGGRWMLDDQRYFCEPLPALAIVWLAAFSAAVPRGFSLLRFDMLQAGGRRTGVVAAVVAGILALEVRFLWAFARPAYSRMAESIRTGPWEPQPLETRLRELAAASPLPDHRIFDAFDGCVAPFIWDERLRAKSFDDLEHLQRSGSSRPVYVIVVVRQLVHPRTGKLDPLRSETETARQYASFFGLRRFDELTDAGMLCEIWAGEVPAYARGTKPGGSR